MADASTSTAPAAAQEESHPYTLETLKQHNTREDLWLLIDGKVYDVTKFMDEVSGGPGDAFQRSRVQLLSNVMTGADGVAPRW